MVHALQRATVSVTASSKPTYSHGPVEIAPSAAESHRPFLPLSKGPRSSSPCDVEGPCTQL